MSERDWEARFEISKGGLPSELKLFSPNALAAALAYCLVITAFMVWMLRTQDAESITFAWLVLGFPAIFFVHALNGCAAVPVNGLIIYAFAALAIAYKKRRVLTSSKR